MREIKFRGKSLNNGEWIYGDLIQWEKQSRYAITPQKGNKWDSVDKYEVMPYTVGQFTELKDRDGKEIFEGDLFKIGLEPNVFEVRFEHGAFLAYENGEQIGLMGELFPNVCKVVGNVHDNPELVKTNV